MASAASNAAASPHRVFRLLHFCLAEQHYQAVGHLGTGNRGIRVEFERLHQQIGASILLGAIGQSPTSEPTFVDHFGMPGAQRDVGVGVLGRQLDRTTQQLLDLAPSPSACAFRHRNPLAVAPQRIRLNVPGIGVLGSAACSSRSARRFPGIPASWRRRPSGNWRRSSPPCWPRYSRPTRPRSPSSTALRNRRHGRPAMHPARWHPRKRLAVPMCNRGHAFFRAAPAYWYCLSG